MNFMRLIIHLMSLLLWDSLLLDMRVSILLSFNNSRGFRKSQLNGVIFHRASNSSQKWVRELRNLISTINYDGPFSRSTRGSLKSFGITCLYMNLKLLSWNVRELNNPHKRDVVKYLLREQKCDIVCLQETKLDNTIFNMVESLWGSPFVDLVVLDAIHIAGGVLLMWDGRVSEKGDCVVGGFSFSILLKGVANGFEWICSGCVDSLMKT